MGRLFKNHASNSKLLLTTLTIERYKALDRFCRSKKVTKRSVVEAALDLFFKKTKGHGGRGDRGTEVRH